MKLKNLKDKLKFKRAGLSNILSFVLLFTLFFSLLISMMFNSITQERRSMVVDYINKEAMILQAKLNGYSKTYNYCYMYQNGTRVPNQSAADAIKDKVIADAKKNIQDKFLEDRYKSQMLLNSVDIVVTDGGGPEDIAKVKIVVKYKALFRSPFNDEEGKASDNSSGKLGVNITDTATRTIENSIRTRNLK